MSAIKFSKQYVQPNPHEVDYWVDLATNPYGAVIKYFNGDDWIQLNGSGGSASSFDVYTKTQINQMLAKKANVGDVDSKVDDDELAEVIKNIEVREIGNDGISLVLFKYDNTNLAVTLPIATETNPGVLSGTDFANFVKQHQLQALYSEMYDLFAEIRSKYQRKLKAGRNIKITSDNVISAEINVGPGSYDAALNELDEKINTETERAIAVEDRIEKRVDQHYAETDNLFAQKANRADVYTKSQVDNKLTGVYKVKGSETYEKLPTSNNVGDVYNITNQFTLNSTTYPAGTNVVYTEYGWDALSGNFDVTALEEDIQTVADDLSKETLRAIEAETYNSNSIINLTNTAAELTTKLNTLTGNVYTVALVDDIVDEYLPLTGGTLTNELIINRDATFGLFINNTAVTNSTGYAGIMFKYSGNNAAGLGGNNDGNLMRVASDYSKYYTIWDEGNDGSGSGLDADLLDGIELNSVGKYILSNQSYRRLASGTDLNDVEPGFWSTLDNTSYTNAPIQNFGLMCLTLNTGYRGQLMFPYTHKGLLIYRTEMYSTDGKVWGDWNEIAYTHSNVASATKLATARTIWGQSFDGTGNIAGHLKMPNNTSIGWEDTGGTNRNSMFLSNSNNLHIGYDIATQGYNTYIDGNNIYLRTSTSHTTVLTLSGTEVTVNGKIKMPNNNSILWKDTNGTYYSSLYLSSNNTLTLGYGTSGAGYNTNIDGNQVSLRYGTSHTVGLELLSSGRISAKGNIDIPNNKAIYFKNSSSTDINSLYFDNSNILHLGYGTSGSYNTKIYGNNLYLHYGSRSVGMILNNSGNVTIGSSDLASTSYKLYVDGIIKTSDSIICQNTSNVVRRVGVANDVGEVSLYIAQSGNRGLYDNTNNCWVLYTNGNTSLNGNAIYFRYGTSNTAGMYLSSSGNFGIGTTTPLHKLHVNGIAYATKFTMSSQTAEITGIARSWTDTYTDSASNARPWCGLSTVSGMKNFEETTLASYFGMLFKTGGSAFPFIFNGGKIGIWTNTPSEALHVNGNILATGTINQESQRDLKNIIDEKVLSLDDMNTINPTRFTWKDNRDEDIHYGGIAEDIQQVIPEVVHKSGDNLTVEYANAAFAMVTSLVKHVKDLEQRLSKLEEDYKQLLLNNKQ